MPLKTVLTLIFCFFAAVSSAGAAGEVRIVALGDSTTAGTPRFRSAAEVPPAGEGDVRSQYAYWLAKRFPGAHVYNRGVNGERSDQIRRRFAGDVMAFNPDVLIVLAGVNDLYQGYPAAWVIANLKWIYDQAAFEKIHVIAATILPYNVSTPEIKKRMREVNDWIRAYAAQQNFAFCDTHALLEDPGKPGFLAASEDGLHPDIEGYRKMGEAIAAILEARTGSWGLGG